MSGFNVSVQQYTPLIRYAPSDAWRPGSPADPQFSKYNDGFRLTTANGSTATFDFTGTGVWIYGAYRLNHGNFSVTLDGTLKGVFNGSKNDQFQVVLYGVGGLENRKHSVELTNIPLSTDNVYVDIDFITYEMQLDERSIANPVQVDMASSNWTYDQSWNIEKDPIQGALLTTTVSGAKNTLTFEGENVEVYGSTGPLYSQFDLSVDGGTNTTLDCYYDEYRPSVLLWSANSLGNGPHRLEITNRPKNTSGPNKLELDHALVRGATQKAVSISTSAASITASVGSNPPGENTAFKSNTGAIIGVVIAIVVFLVVVAAAALHWQRKKKLVERPLSPYIPPMSSISSILPITHSSSGNGLQGSHPKNGGRVRPTAAVPATYHNIHPEGLHTTSNPSSPDESNLSATSSFVVGSQLSSSTAASLNVMSHQPVPLPMSYNQADARDAYLPRGQSGQLSHLPATSEPRTQPLPPLPPARPHPPSEPQQPLSSHQSSDFTGTPTYSSAYSTESPGMRSSYAYQQYPQSIFGDQGDMPGSRSEITSPPPDYWSSAGQRAR